MVAAIYNISRGTVVRPHAFWIILAGLICFLSGKLSVIVRKQLISFGAARMSQNMANVYRLGYWLMCLGILATFA